jgi:hypothetical protein
LNESSTRSKLDKQDRLKFSAESWVRKFGARISEPNLELRTFNVY